MSWSPLSQRYGFGAGRVPLSPPVTAQSRELVPLIAGLRALWSERESGATRRALLRASPPLCLAFLLTALLAMLTGPRDETRIVPFAEMPAPVEPPVQIASAPPPAPPPVPTEPEPIEAPAPEPAAPEPMPEPTPQPRARPKPQPALPVLAAIEEPRHAESSRSRPRPSQAPRTQPAPALRPEALAARPEPIAKPRRRTAHRNAGRSDPRTTPPRLAAAGPVPARVAAAAPRTRERSSRPAPRAVRPRTPSPALAAPATHAPSPGAPAPRSGNRSGRVATARPRRRGSRPGLAGPTAPPAERAPTGSSPSPRTAPPRSAAPARSQRAGARSDIPGVPLAALAACVSDAEEHALKQRIVGGVRGRRSCESRFGRYHFVETKNVNAFLMRIERSSGRRVGDRCTALTYALDCLSK